MTRRSIQLALRPSAVQPVFVFVLMAALLAPLLAFAGTTPVVYHSPADDGSRPGVTPTLAPSPSETLHLYMDESDATADASPSNVCGGGSGDERCGWELTLDASGLVDFVSFTPSGDVVSNLTTGVQPLLRFNGGVPDLGELGPVKLGDLEITSTGDGEVGLAAGTVVDSAQQKVTLASDVVVYVPEPGFLTGLLAGLVALRGLLGWRERNGGGAG